MGVSRSLNRVQLMGNLASDPEMRSTGGGANVTTFVVATNKSWKDSDGNEKEDAQFHNIVAWNKLAEICNQLLAKGMKVFVEGELMHRKWEDDSGQMRYKTEVRINDMVLLDSKGKGGVGANNSNSMSAGNTSDDSHNMAQSVASDDSSANTADEDPLADEI